MSYNCKPVGEAWKIPVNLSNTPGEAEHLDIAADNEGNVVVVWQEGYHPAHIKYTMKNVNESWIEPATIGEGRSPSITTDANGTMHCIWNNPCYSQKSKGGNWSEPVLLPDIRGGFGDIAVDSNGIIHVVGSCCDWIDSVYGNWMFHISSPQGSEWSSPIRLSPIDDQSCSDMTLSMTADNIGNIHLSYFRIQDYGIWYTSFNQVPLANFTATPTSGTVPLEVQFTDQSESNPIGWLWDFGYGQTSTEQNPTHIYESPGTYNVSLTVSIPPSTNNVIRTDCITVSENEVAPLPHYRAERLYNPTPQSQAYGIGKSVVSVGDVDDDGTSDFLIGAPYQKVGENIGQGQALLISGATKQILFIMNNPYPQSSANFGDPVALAGDVNSDGTPDFLIGAPFQKVGGNWGKGQAFVFNGATGELLLTLDNPNPQSITQFGASLSSAGDINEDGFSDLLIGCNNGKQAFVFDGSTGELLLTLSDPNTQEHSYFGISVASAGDVNMDEIPDLLIGCPKDESTGQAYVFSGATSELLLTLSNPQLFTKGSSFGWCVAPAEDINGDGTPDLLVGVYYHGKVFVFDGDTGGLILTLNLPPSDQYYHGQLSIAAIGDMNRDGTPDVLIGESSTEQAFIFSGVTGGILMTLNNPEPQEYAYFGSSVAVAEDVDDDNIPDLLIGACGQNVDYYGNHGQVFLFRSSEIIAEFNATPTSGKAPLTIQFICNSIGNITNMQWDFDDDGTIDSTEQNPSYTYQNAGMYAVCLKVTGSGGSDTELKADCIAVYEVPVANFSITPTIGVAPFEVQFTDKSIGTITNWHWDFNNDSKVDSTKQNPIYTFTEAGNYTISLIVSNPVGTNTKTKTESIEVISQQPEVWVDDDWVGFSPGELVEGHIFSINAFTNIQDGIDAVKSPGTVHVSAGTYNGNINLKDGVKLLGAGADVTTIDYGEDGSVVTAINVGTGTVLDGFKINNSNCWNPGDGIHIKYGEMNVSNNIIVGNCVGISAFQSSLFIQNNILENNTVCAIAIQDTYHATVTGNIITKNGDGISILGGSFANISNNTVSNNSGGISINTELGIVANNRITENSNVDNFYALSVSGGSSIINGNIVCDNCGRCTAGIAIFESSNTTVKNNIIARNIAQDSGGGILIGRAKSLLIINNVIIDNSPKGIVGGTPTIINCILWGNGDDLDGCTATYSNIEDGDLGDGNIYAYPMFINPNDGDYHLRSGSPCIDTGKNISALITDFDGNHRPIDGDEDGISIVDIGAFEYKPVMSCDTFEKELVLGWNLISLPLIPGNNNTNAVLGNDTIEYDKVSIFNATSKQFEDITTGTMNTGIGYYVNITTAGTWRYEGTSPISLDIILKPGLNMIGWLNNSKEISDALSPIESKYIYVARWNATSQSFEQYNPHAPNNINHFTTMDKGVGFFISMTQEEILTIA